MIIITCVYGIQVLATDGDWLNNSFGVIKNGRFCDKQTEKQSDNPTAKNNTAKKKKKQQQHTLGILQ